MYVTNINDIFLDWTETDYGQDPIAAGDVASLMPLVINYLTPKAVAIIGIIASQLH